MDFRLVPKSVTLNERLMTLNFVVILISPNSVGFGAHYIKVVD